MLTWVSPGLPYPDNLALASQLEELVRANGAVPATIGVLDGVARVGLTGLQMQQLLDPGQSSHTLKVSRRDLGFICAKVRLGL